MATFLAAVMKASAQGDLKLAPGRHNEAVGSAYHSLHTYGVK